MAISNGFGMVKTSTDWTIKRSTASKERCLEECSTTTTEGTLIKAIPDYDGYFVDNQGNVYCNLGKGNRRNGKTVEMYQLKPKRMKTGYLQIRMRNSVINKVKYLYIHRLVARLFVDNPENKTVVNHKNCKRDDNRAENLEWVTVKENFKHTINLKHLVKNQNGVFVGCYDHVHGIVYSLENTSKDGV